MPICEMVRNAKRRTGASFIAVAATRAMILVRSSRGSQPSETTAWNARSVVSSRRRATGMRSCS